MSRVPRVQKTAAAASLLLLMTACGGDDSGGSGGSDDDFELAFANFTEAAPLFRVIHTNLDDVLAKGDSGLSTSWYDNAADPAKMTENAQLMVQAQPDAIVMYPDRKSVV